MERIDRLPERGGRAHRYLASVRERSDWRGADSDLDWVCTDSFRRQWCES